jgi:hypothetical protein
VGVLIDLSRISVHQKKVKSLFELEAFVATFRDSHSTISIPATTELLFEVVLYLAVIGIQAYHSSSEV